MGFGSFFKGRRDDGGEKKVKNQERKTLVLYSHETQGAPRPPQDYPETDPNAQASSGNTGPIGDVLYEQQQNKPGKHRKPGPMDRIIRKAIGPEADRDKKLPEQRDHDDIDPNKNGPPIGNTPGELGLVPYSHNRVANVGENSGSFQSPSTPEGENTRSGSWFHDEMASRDNGPPSGIDRGRPSHDPHASSRVANVSVLSETIELSPSKSEEQRIRRKKPNQDIRSANEIYLSNASVPNKPGLDAHGRPRDADADGASEPLQGEESQGTETRHEEENSGFKEVMERISRRLHQFKRELSPELSAIVSTHFDREIPRFCSLEDIGMAIDGLIKALQSSNQDAHDIKTALLMSTTQCESLTKSREEWAQEKKELEDKVSTLKRDKEREKENCVEATRLAMKAEHKEAQEEQQSAWRTKENEYKLRLHQHEESAKQLEQQHKKRLSMLLQERKTMEDGYDIRIRQLEMEKETWENTYKSKEAELGQLHQTQITSLQRDNKIKITEITKECDDTVIELEDSIERLTSKHVGELNQLRLQYQEHMVSLQKRLEGEIAQKERDCSDRVSRLEDFLKAKQQQYEMDKKQTATRYHNDKAATERNLTATINNLYAEKNAMREGHDKEMNEMREDHNAIVVALGKQREEEQRSLREQVQSLKGALVNRDGFKAMSDHKLASCFQELTCDVDALARARWDIGRVRTWPFPDEAFLKSENPRMDKQYLVQNTIWVILYEKIFFTPFRVLRMKGKSLEQQWMAKFGQGKLLV